MSALDEMAMTARLVEQVEQRVQTLLLALDEALIDCGVRVEHVVVDTRRWANMLVNVTVCDRKSQP